MHSFTPRSSGHSGTKPKSFFNGVMSHCQFLCFMMRYLSPFSVLALWVSFEHPSAILLMIQSSHKGALMCSTFFTPNSF